MGGGGSREEEARNPPPGNSSARLRNEALLSLGDRGRRSAAPARPGEARGESGGRRPAPRPPAAAESPGPAGAGRGGAWERLAGGGGLGARRRAAPDRRPARTGSLWACGARCPGAGQPRTDPLAPLPPVRVCWLFRLSREGAAPAGGWRARLVAGSLPSRHLAQPALAWGRREPAASAGWGRRGRARMCRRRRAGGRREGHKGRWRARGSGPRPWRRGASRPLMNINRACGLARPGRARRPARVPAPARRCAQRAGRVSPSLFVFPPGLPTPFSKYRFRPPGRSRSLTRLWKGRRKSW